jgi:hypothetical protein
MSVTLSFTGGANGAWDDRELVNAYDTAMEEFHVGLAHYVSMRRAHSHSFTIQVQVLGWTR